MNQKKIAQIAKVSPSTVSKALSGSKEVSPALAEEIKNIAIREGYFDEKRKRRVEKNRKKGALIAVVCPEIISVYYCRIISNIKEEVEKRGGQVAVYIYDFDEQKLNDIFKMIILKNETDGIITFSQKKLQVKPSIPTVVLNKDDDEEEQWCDIVCAGGYEVTNEAINYLKKMGHKKIGFVGEKYTIGRCKNFVKALENNEIEVNNNYIYESDKRFDKAGYDAAIKIFESEDRPTAVLAAYDEIAMGLIHELNKKGITVPNELSVMGINDIFYASFAQIPLTTVQVYKHQQGVEAVRLLYEKILKKNNELQKFVVGYRLIIRDTVKNLNKEADNNDR